VSESPAAPRIAAVIVHYRTPHDTARAVQSLTASNRPLSEIIVVNNDRHTDAGACLAHAGPSVVWHEAGSNTGFAGGVNRGVRVARSRGAAMVLLVNSDATVRPDCVTHLEASLARHPSAGIAGPMVVSSRAPDRVESLGMSYRPVWGRLRHVAFGAGVSTVDRETIRDVDAVAGCLMLIRAEVFDRIGPFDEEFFFGYEELEFCLRAGRAGMRSLVNPAAVADHAGGASIEPTSSRRLYFAARNHLLLAYKLAPHAGAITRAARTVSIAALNVAHAIRADGESAGSRLRAVARGTADYLAGRFGPDSHAD
jgi:GT2 family glycosyltransferase